MQSIRLHNVIPEVFAQREDLRSDIWLSDFELERGKRYLIEAESGAGKSSLCSYLYGQRDDYRGEILFDGEDIRRFTVGEWSRLRQRSVAILFQDLKLFDELTALENVELKNRLTKTQSRATILSWFEELGIVDKVNAPVGRMSYGQQQRVALIRALCQPLDFLLLDEPISHLDDRNSEVVRDIILRETERQGAAIIVTSIGKHIDLNYDKVVRL
ncbi:MAG: ATP-binding cassette domain-containing protein [Alistipes sp.]|nr:ATP-binding cassette domain-containing protein [Alistipes sp.]